MPTSTVLPEQFGRYRVLKKLGEGGMGAVYLAEDGQLGRKVALKVPHFGPEDGPEVIERFYREARVAASIEHANICAVHDVGQVDGVHYLTMPYIDGVSLAQQLNRKQPWPPERAAALVIRLATALHAVHQRGIMHRDLKPQNIMLRAGDDPVIMDFGLARALDQGDRLTRTGAVVGTPAYMSPEQIMGDPRAVGCATDIYSLGVILYELLTGQLPFPGPGPALFGQILHAEAQPPSTVRPGLDPVLDAVCRKAMAKKAAERYASMGELAAALQTYLNARQAAAPASTATYRAGEAAAVVRLVCPRCRRALRVPSGSGARRARCPGCQAVVDIPPEAQAVPTVPPAAPLSAPSTPTPRPPSSRTERAEPGRRPRRVLLALAAAGLVAVLLTCGLIGLLVGKHWGAGRDGDGTLAADSGVGLPKDTELARQRPTGSERESRRPVQVPEKKGPEGPARPVPGQRFTNGVGMDMVPIVAGEFHMGSEKAADDMAYDDELPRHPVTIGRPFRMAVHKVTQAQFERVVGRNPSYFSATGGGKDRVQGLDTGRFPVETVSYLEAVEFCNKLSKMEGTRPCYRVTGASVELLADGTGYRLPSEAEWEYCARAGEKVKRYWFGNDPAQLGEHAWFEDNSGGGMRPVGKKGANPWNLCDMGGLVWEWCDDVGHNDYQGAPQDGSAWLTGGDQARRVVRGGSWNLEAGYCRPAYRGRYEAGFRLSYLGFRVVLPSP
jgi:LSD1 subclass zinc finger protein